MVGIEVCGNCRFWADRECRRFPPVFVPTAYDGDGSSRAMNIDHITAYPYLKRGHPACGEFRARENESPRAVRHEGDAGSSES